MKLPHMNLRTRVGKGMHATITLEVIPWTAVAVCIGLWLIRLGLYMAGVGLRIQRKGDAA